LNTQEIHRVPRIAKIDEVGQETAKKMSTAPEMQYDARRMMAKNQSEKEVR